MFNDTPTRCNAVGITLIARSVLIKKQVGRARLTHLFENATELMGVVEEEDENGNHLNILRKNAALLALRNTPKNVFLTL
jgi:hypothetical protein